MNHTAKKLLARVWEIVLAVGLLGLVITTAPYVEQHINPVMVSSDTVLTKIEPQGYLATIVEGSAIRKRDCTFESLRWYYGVRGERAVNIGVRFLEGPKIRPSGHMEFGPWKLQISADRIEQTFADVFHQCRVFGIKLPWLSRSSFYK